MLPDYIEKDSATTKLLAKFTALGIANPSLIILQHSVSVSQKCTDPLFFAQGVRYYSFIQAI